MAALTDLKRLQALEKSGLLDTLPELDFDRVTGLICQLMKVDISLVSLVDGSRQYFKSRCGLPDKLSGLTGTPLSHSFCQHVVIHDKALMVGDARLHPLVRDNLAVRDLNVIAYLGVPLHFSSERHVIGSLCAIHSAPRNWTEGDRQALEEFAKIVENAIELRVKTTDALELSVHHDTLAKEYNHRVKNFVAVVSALVNMSAREADTKDALALMLQGRLRAYADAHDAIQRSGGVVDLRALLERLLAPYSLSGQQMVVGGPEVALTAQQVTPICLIIHELATNSAKYGAIKHASDLMCTWAITANGTELLWMETIPGLEGAPGGPSGFGDRLLQVAARQLDGSFERIWDRGAMTVKLTMGRPEV